MDINSQDSSHQAEISRLKSRIDALEAAQPVDLLADPASDIVEIEQAEAKARQERARKAAELFKASEAALKRIDDAIDAIGDAFREDTGIRRKIEFAGLLSGIDKFDREQIRGDARVNSLILARLGEFGICKDRRHDRNEVIPKLASLAEIHARIITAIQKG
jgi:hypothetical protein